MSLLSRIFGSSRPKPADVGHALGSWAADTRELASACSEFAERYSLAAQERTRLTYGFAIVRAHLIGVAGLHTFGSRPSDFEAMCAAAGQSYGRAMIDQPSPSIDIADFAASPSEFEYLLQHLAPSERVLPAGVISNLLGCYRHPRYREDLSRAIDDQQTFSGRDLNWYVADRFRVEISARQFPADTQRHQRAELTTLLGLAFLGAVALTQNQR